MSLMKGIFQSIEYILALVMISLSLAFLVRCVREYIAVQRELRVLNKERDLEIARRKLLGLMLDGPYRRVGTHRNRGKR